MIKFFNHIKTCNCQRIGASFKSNFVELNVLELELFSFLQSQLYFRRAGAECLTLEQKTANPEDPDLVFGIFYKSLTLLTLFKENFPKVCCYIFLLRYNSHRFRCLQRTVCWMFQSRRRQGTNDQNKTLL